MWLLVRSSRYSVFSGGNDFGDLSGDFSGPPSQDKGLEYCLRERGKEAFLDNFSRAKPAGRCFPAAFVGHGGERAYCHSQLVAGVPQRLAGLKPVLSSQFSVLGCKLVVVRQGSEPSFGREQLQLCRTTPLFICHPEGARPSAAKKRDRRTCFSSFLSKPDFLTTGHWSLVTQ